MSSLPTTPVTDIAAGLLHPHSVLLTVQFKIGLPEPRSSAESDGTTYSQEKNELQDSDAFGLCVQSPVSTVFDEPLQDPIEGIVSGEQNNAVALPAGITRASPVIVCFCENKMTEEERRKEKEVPYLFWYDIKHQERLTLKQGICNFRHAEPCPVHQQASVPAYMYPPIPQLIISPMGELVVDAKANGPTLIDLPAEIFHHHLFAYLFDCELLKLGQTCQFFNKLIRAEVFRRCKQLELLDDSKVKNLQVLRGDMPSDEADFILKRNLARYHKRMESLLAIQGARIGPYWNLKTDFRAGFPRILASLCFRATAGFLGTVSFCTVLGGFEDQE